MVNLIFVFKIGKLSNRDFKNKILIDCEQMSKTLISIDH